MANHQPISFKVSEADDSTTITWSRGGAEFQPYEIKGTFLVKASEQVRNRLGQLVSRCMKDKSGATCGAELKRLAEAGHELYRVLFKRVGGDGDPEEIKQWLEDQKDQVRFEVVVLNNRIHVPWGLIYDADPKLLTGSPDDTDLKLYEAFWSLKHKLATMYFTLTPRVREAPPKQIDFFKLLPVMNRETFRNARRFLTGFERTVTKLLMKDFGAPVYSKEQLLAKWALEGEDVDVLYFYCHASGASLDIGDDELSLMNISMDLERKLFRERDYFCLVFLNGCSTAVGDAKGGFLDATGSPGYCGFIGTEHEVPDIFALRFGLAFLYHLIYEGLPVYQVMDLMRRAHWPLSLVYSTNCNPLLKVELVEAPAIPPEKFDNFSTTDLATHDDAYMRLHY
jgi:hypothetical protein